MQREYKRCPCCGETKHISDFHSCVSRPDGVQSYCKPCMNKYTYQKQVEKKKPKTKTSTLRYGRNSMVECMILFFIAGTLGTVLKYKLAVVGGFSLAIISSVIAILMTIKINQEEKQ